MFFLLLLLLISYGPYWAWKELEGGKIKKLCSDMLIFPYTEDRDSKVDRYVAIVLIQTYYHNDDLHRLLQGFLKERDQNVNYRKSFQILELLMAKCFYHRHGVGGKITYIFI